MNLRQNTNFTSFHQTIQLLYGLLKYCIRFIIQPSPIAFTDKKTAINSTPHITQQNFISFSHSIQQNSNFLNQFFQDYLEYAKMTFFIINLRLWNQSRGDPDLNYSLNDLLDKNANTKSCILNYSTVKQPF